jgi:glycosyltransferase involved in cell wall biosynthesis
MKLLFVVQAYAPSLGGVQLLVQKLAEHMVADHGDEVTVYTTTAYECRLFQDATQPAMSPGVERINGVTVRRFSVFNGLAWLRLNAARVAYKLRLPGQDWLRTAYFGPLVPGMTAAVQSSGADVVVGSSFPMMHMYAALRGGQVGDIPVVLVGTIHPTDVWGYDMPMIYSAVGKADAYVALTDYERRYLASRGVSVGHVTVIGTGVEADAFDSADARASGQEMRREHGWADEPVVAMIGRQTEYKRFDLALAAMQQVWRSVPKARLLIAGASTHYSPHLNGMVAALASEERAKVTVLSDFEEFQKPAILAASDLLIQPSERESFGIVLLEAWASGLPVIGARAGAIPSVISEGQDGLLVTYGSVGEWARAIERLLTQPTLCASMGAEGRRKVRAQYTWDVITRRYREVCVEAIRHRREKSQSSQYPA